MQQNISGNGTDCVRSTQGEVWRIGLAIVTIINASALLGVVFLPLMNQRPYKYVMTFMVALAVGCLAGSAILVLIPETFQLDVEGYEWKSSTVLAGIYGFFLLEHLLKHLIELNSTSRASNVQLDIPSAVIRDSNHPHYHAGDDAVSVETGHSSRLSLILNKLLSKNIAPVAWMIILGDGVHNFVDGLSIGAAFNRNLETGLTVSVAVLCEELPHELGDFAVLLTSGMSMKQALTANFLSACTCYLGFVVGATVSDGHDNFWIFGLAGGMFLYISLVDMMPEVISMYQSADSAFLGRKTVFMLHNLGLLLGYGVILGMTFFGKWLESKEGPCK